MCKLKDVVTLIRTSKLDLSTEKRAQSDFEQRLKDSGVWYEREVRLSDHDIVDFLIDGIAIEFKLRPKGKKAVYRQLCRYATYDRVKAVMLVSCTSMGIPEQIDGKDTYFVKLGEAWL